MTTFGKLLRELRSRCSDPYNLSRRLSQQRLGQLLGDEMGDYGFSGAAVSDWEKGKSKIHADNRPILISLLKVLYKNGGLKTLSDADSLLEAGNYRNLNHNEQQLFPGFTQETHTQPPPANPNERTPYLKLLLSGAFFNSPEELEKLLSDANEGPPPAWPRIGAALLRMATDRWSVLNFFRALIWIWIWLVTYLLIAPSLRWPFASEEQALTAMVLYAGGSLILPLVMGASTNTKNMAFWQEHKIANALTTRLYVHQGAFTGFYLGYFIVFAIELIGYHLTLRPAVWFNLTIMAIPLVISHAAAQLIPYNLWQAYKRLRLKDGGVFFIFVFIGPLWALFFFESYPLLTSPLTGIPIILASITLLVALMTWQYRRSGDTVIPVHWWIIFYGTVLICQIISSFIR